jgi:hypothetical protein
LTSATQRCADDDLNISSIALAILIEVSCSTGPLRLHDCALDVNDIDAIILVQIAWIADWKAQLANPDLQEAVR